MRVKKNNFTENEISKALKIYNYFIENSFSNFEEKKLSKLKFNLLLKKIKKNKLPFILAIEENEVIGLAFVNNLEKKVDIDFHMSIQSMLIQISLIMVMAIKY